MTNVEILRKAILVDKPVRRCVCGGKILVNGSLLGYCEECGLDYSRVNCRKLLFMPVFNCRQKEVLEKEGML